MLSKISEPLRCIQINLNNHRLMLCSDKMDPNWIFYHIVPLWPWPLKLEM